METYKYEKIRNVAVLGHGGCGKTTLVEAMAYVQGMIKRQGKVEDGNTISDYDKEEIKRHFSIHTSVVPVIWEGTKINFLDTPGYFDFTGETEEALSAAEAAVIVISAKAGIEIGTRRATELCGKMNLPYLYFVTDMDDDNASYREVVENLSGLYGKKIAPFQLPIRENGKFTGFVNVIKSAGRRFLDQSHYEECEIPGYSMDYLSNYRESLLESVAETSEELMEKYLNGEEFTLQEIATAMRSNVIDGNIVPVLMGSGLKAQGVTMLMQAIDIYFPSPNKTVITGVDTKTDRIYVADYDANKEMTAKVFKTISDPFTGRFSLIKVCSGILTADAAVYNPRTQTEDKLSRLYVLNGKEQIEVKELYAGDIGAIGKLSDTKTGDSLSTKGCPVEYDRPKLSKPYTYRRFLTKSKGDDDKVSQALSKLLEEDLTLKVVQDKRNHQTLLFGIGEQQLEVAASKLLQRYKVEVELKKPRIAYEETIRRKVKVQGRHKKQSGGAGQFGDVWIEFEPSGDLSHSYQFEEKVFGGAVPKNFFPAVEKGIAESVLKGPLAGYPVVGLKAVLVDGSYHPVDSNEMAFKMAAIKAFKNGIMEASPILLEPYVTLTVSVPEKFMGDIMGDLNKRRGRILGMNPSHNGKEEIVADVPVSSVYSYATELRAMTGGLGEYSYDLEGDAFLQHTFSHYEPAPSDVQAKIIEEAQKELSEG